MDSDYGSSEEVVEVLEERGTKRQHAEVEESEEDGDDNEATENGESNDAAGMSGKKRRKLKKENELKKLHKPPTADELKRLRETENLFHSNLFQLQIKEMLEEIQMKSKYKKEFQTWFDKFSEWILKVEDGENKYEIPDQAWLKNFKLKIPVPQVPYFVNGNYEFKVPSKIELIGSYSNGTFIGPKLTVDVHVEIPDSFFQSQGDLLNTCYHRKRALYMCDLVHHITFLRELTESVNFVVDEGNNLKPLIEVIPYGKLSKYVTVLLHLAPEYDCFKLSRLAPIQNNIKKEWFMREQNSELDADDIPTPFYNSTILSDIVMLQNDKYIKSILLQHDNLKDGIKLLKVWLRQRELDSGLGGFSGFLVSMLVCYLIKIKKINLLMSCYQVFRNVCNYLIGADWTVNGITLCDSRNDVDLPSMAQFHEHHKVVFVDVTGYHNICYGMCAALFRRLQDESRLALKGLDDTNINSFEMLYMKPVPFYRHYDHVVSFCNSEALEGVAEAYSSLPDRLSHVGVHYPQYRDLIVKVLERGFGNRLSQLHVRQSTKNRWKTSKKPRAKSVLTLGFNMDAEHCFGILEKAAENETEEFRKFWGSKSELRRFKDGAITEAVVWSAKTMSERRLICKEMFTYLLKQKFGLLETDFVYVADQLEKYLAKNIEEKTLTFLETFDDLTKALRGLKDLPLDIVSAQGNSPVFRFTDVFPPVPARGLRFKPKNEEKSNRLLIKNSTKCPSWVSPVEVILQLGASKKWPHDVEAIRRIRAAFNVKISEALSTEHKVVCQAFQNGIELVMNGYVFRLVIFYPNEIGLMKQTIGSDGLVKYVDTEKSLAIEKKLVHLPKLCGALHGMHQKYSSFGAACCLVKRWVRSHMMDAWHVSDEALELLVASLYLHPQPHQTPEQPQVAFLRFLHMMATKNWNNDCIVININEELNRQDILEIESDFQSRRSSLPAIFIATPYDRTKSIWTKDSPSPLILLRLVQLSARFIQMTENRIYSNTTLTNASLFQPSYDVFDLLIHLKPVFVPQVTTEVEPVNREGYKFYKIPINGFNPPALYLKELRESYSDFALFFHDSYAGNVIGVLWKPCVGQEVDFKISNLAGRTVNEASSRLEVNKDMIVDDFFQLGDGLIESIEMKFEGEFIPFQLTYE